MGLVSAEDKVIDIVKADTSFKGVYYGDQMGYSDYPVACIGAPSLLDEKEPVISTVVRDDIYKIEIVIYVDHEDTEANAKSIKILTDTMRSNLRADLTLGGYCYLGEMLDSKFLFGSKGDRWLRMSITTVKYTKRIS